MRKHLIIVGWCLFIASQCLAADKVFVMTPSDPAKTYPKFHVGVSGIYATIEKGLLVTVDSTEPGTPAAGKFQKGDVLIAVNGKAVTDPEPYLSLGNALTAAEASDGKLAFAVKRDGKEETVEITISVLGAYSKTWPLNCKKSDKIVRQTAAFIMQPEILKNPGFFGGLFLLSTGDDQYLPAVKELVDRNSPEKAGSQTWVNGYQGILIGEYYLRTGDKSALPRLKALCVDAKERQYYGGWNHWGPTPGPGYVNGGLMNPAGVQILTSLILAKECGVDVDQGTFDRALTFFYRFVGHASVPYGDHRPEGWLSCNGKNGMLAGALSLLDGKAYQMAAQTMGLDMADSYRWLGAGHANAFGDHVWRGLGSVHVPEDKQDHYRRSMDKLTWYYDLSRHPKGGFGLLNIGTGVGDDPAMSWGFGHGVALAYTAPRKTLRITGAPHTRFSKKFEVPDRPWGRPRDVEFLQTDYCKGFGKEELEPHELYERLSDAKLTDKAFLARMMRHYNPSARTMAAVALGRLGATNEIVEALRDADPRVRRAGLDAVEIYKGWGRYPAGAFSPDVVSAKCVSWIEKILKDPDVALWELDGALVAMSRSEPEDIQRNIDRIRPYLDHEEWWLRESAGHAVAALAKQEKLIEPELPGLMTRLAKETHVYPRRQIMVDLQSMLKDRSLSADFRAHIASGMAQAMRDTVIEPGVKSVIGLNNKYETTRFFLEQAPETALQVVGEMERLMAQADVLDTWYFGAYLTGDGWGNPGVIKSLERLTPEQRAPILAACKRVMAQVEEKKREAKEQGKDVTKIETMQAAVAKAIREYEMDWRELLPTSKTTPQPWRYLMWNADTRPTPAEGGLTRLPDAPPPTGMENWYRPEFDDSGWKEANGIFGVWKAAFSYLKETITTEWTSDYIFLRKSFQLAEVDMTDMRLKVLVRDATEVYLNGQSVFKATEAVSTPVYQIVEVDPKFLRKGNNTVAVHARVNYWLKNPYGLIDVGLRGGKENR